MSAVDDEDVRLLNSAKPQKVRPCPLRAIFLAIFAAQYAIIAVCVGLSVTGVLHYRVTPHIVERFEAIAAALRR